MSTHHPFVPAAPAEAPPAAPVLQALRASFGSLPRPVGGQHRCIIAVSGGPDSQALLDGVGRLASELWLQPQAVGINHGLRAAAADELQVAQRLAQAHGVPFQAISVQLPGTGNLLAQARKARYRALRRAAVAWGASTILVAHTLNDQAETALFHLVRGTGLKGAAGMASRRGLICRPLLGVTRAQVLAHLQQHHIPHAFDPSNAQQARSRIALRSHVLPALCAINAAALEHLGAFARLARADDQLLERLARRLLSRCQREHNALCAATLARGPQALWPRVLRLWLRPLGCRPDAQALGRLMGALTNPQTPLAQGAMAGATVHLRRGLLHATPSAALPPRRAGS